MVLRSAFIAALALATAAWTSSSSTVVRADADEVDLDAGLDDGGIRDDDAGAEEPRDDDAGPGELDGGVGGAQPKVEPKDDEDEDDAGPAPSEDAGESSRAKDRGGVPSM